MTVRTGCREGAAGIRQPACAGHVRTLFRCWLSSGNRRHVPPRAIRNEKAKVYEAIRIMKPQDVLRNTARGQYGPGATPDGKAVSGYRQEEGVDPSSATETYAALRLFVDNWRWEGVPIYLRSGKALWKRGTEIVVAFRKAPEVIFRDTRRNVWRTTIDFSHSADQASSSLHASSRPDDGPAKVNMRGA